MKQLLPPTALGRRFSYVLTATCELFDIPRWEDLVGPRRSRDLAYARQCAMAVMREAFGMSFPEIGRLFERDHTTVLHACRKVAGRQEFLQLLANVRSAFGLGLVRQIPTSQGPVVRRSSTEN